MFGGGNNHLVRGEESTGGGGLPCGEKHILG